MERDYYNDVINQYLVEDENLFRFGSIGDGGYYVNPKIIKEANILFSGGISSNLEFEYDVFRFNNKIKIFMVDPTVSKLKLVTKGFFRLFLNKKEKIKYLYNTLFFIYMTRSNRCWHVSKWLSDKNKIFDIISDKVKIDDKVKIFLKLDIEGSEYELLDEIVNNLDLFNCLIFEFHDLDKKNQLFYKFIEKCSAKFNLVYIGNNPSGGFDKQNRPKVVEVTLQKK